MPLRSVNPHESLDHAVQDAADAGIQWQPLPLDVKRSQNLQLQLSAFATSSDVLSIPCWYAPPTGLQATSHSHEPICRVLQRLLLAT
ncbi:uncharacterized protein LAESUDRAFT_730766 [Laetiporus sulphureus 93-53]|uniref:Uncharacterized protein n=1 Tax=Laetiporus sulphureus 93-53 TaxID=1314785 RepID=A0A165BYA7_9APHY|nr:uncharacterized protein LAESUDRAFT_730766 [Laetiporus sulphureus 93-53]KZT01870.1 hypothetical protein LAESUDRAFT_730766 [Laetiporus sulphureus 93-53]